MAAVLDKKAIYARQARARHRRYGFGEPRGRPLPRHHAHASRTPRSYEVWRDDAGNVRCTCLEFEEQSATEPRYRCEHILAVKHALLNKSTEAAAKQQPRDFRPAGAGRDARKQNGWRAGHITQPASEKHGEAAAEVRAPRKTPRFVREQNEQPEVAQATVEIAPRPRLKMRSLADNEETEE